jgi:hypothetical protein
MKLVSFPAPTPRRAPILAAAPVIVALALAGCGSSASSPTTATRAPAPTTSSTPTTSTANAGSPHGPEGVPLEAGAPLAPASTTAPGTTVDGIQCAPIEQLAYHIHVHLQVYVNGRPRALPAAIGMLGPVAQQTPYGAFYGAQKCYYWLHTHASDGIIHIESPTRRIYTLGDFFAEWRQPLGSDQVAGSHGTVTATFNGKPWTKSPAAIPLIPHAVIQLAVGQPVPPFHSVNWAATSL